MCGIVGVASNAPVNQLIYDALLLLQHRGQDAAGIVTQLERKFFMHKAKGMVRDVFRTRNMRALPGPIGLGQVRYPTAGNAYSEEEAQPFYVNAPFGLVLVHNGNLTNAQALKSELFTADHRHINTESDSEVLLNVLAHELERTTRGFPLSPQQVFAAVRGVQKRIRGSYAVIAMIAGHGLLAFRDPYGIRPLCMGRSADGTVMLASESVALEGTGHHFERNIAPGEAVFIDLQGQVHAQVCADAPFLSPCIFEFVYLARPDSVLDGISVYQARLNLGETLAKRVISTVPPNEIDVVIPISCSQTVCAPKTQCHRERVQGPQRAAGGRLHCAWHHQPRDCPNGPRRGCAQGVHGQRCATCSLPQCLRHRHAHQRRIGGLWPHGGRSPGHDRL